LAQPSILDVVHAVKRVAPAHPTVSAWWYTPPQRLRLAGALPTVDPDDAVITVVVEGAPETFFAPAQVQAVERALSAALKSAPVRVRAHLGSDEERPLFRLLSRSANEILSKAPSTA
jgi:hypothetical protein